MKTIAFFGIQGGVGKTMLVYHLAWMFHELGLRVLAVDLAPQPNLTTAFLDDERLEALWADDAGTRTLLGAVKPVFEHLGDVEAPHIEDIEGIGLIPGDPGLQALEERLGAAWAACLDDDTAIAASAFREITAFHRVMLRADAQRASDVALIDLGSNLGSINRAALVASEFVVVTLVADLFSLRGLRTLGPKLHEWRSGWDARRSRGKVPAGLSVPAGSMEPIGYVISQLSAYQGRIQRAHLDWVRKIPASYREAVLGQPAAPAPLQGDDAHMLAGIKHYRSLMPLAQDARKPVFALRPADGAIGGQAQAVAEAHADFENLAREIAKRCGIVIS